MENPSYFAVIPADVRYAKMKPNAKLLYWEITALANKTGECFAGNGYFAQLYWVSEKQITVWIKELVNNWFIFSRVEKEQGNKRFIAINQKVCTYPPKGGYPYPPKGVHNNTRVNTTFNTTNNIEVDDLIKKFIKNRKAMKKPMTQIAVDTFTEKVVKILDKYDVEIVKTCFANSFESWRLTIYEPKNQNQKEKISSEQNRQSFTF